MVALALATETANSSAVLTSSASSGICDRFGPLYDEASDTYKDACSRTSIFNSDVESTIPRLHRAGKWKKSIVAKLV